MLTFLTTYYSAVHYEVPGRCSATSAAMPIPLHIALLVRRRTSMQLATLSSKPLLHTTTSPATGFASQSIPASTYPFCPLHTTTTTAPRAQLALLFPHAFWDTTLDTIGHVSEAAEDAGLFFLFYAYGPHLAGDGAVLAALVSGARVGWLPPVAL